jgi:CheY-like chemotaxis protein
MIPGPKVLVAHDLGCNAAVVTDQLLRYGFEPRPAFDGARVLEIARSWQPDAAIIELGMKSAAPLEIGAKLRSLYGRGIRLVGFTAPTAPQLEDQALAAGFDHVVLQVEDAAEILMALGGPSAELVRRTRSALFGWQCTVPEHGFHRVKRHALLHDPQERRHNAEVIRRAVESVAVYLGDDSVEPERRAYLKFQLALLENQQAEHILPAP